MIDGKSMEVTGDPLNPYREPVPVQSWEQAIEAYKSAYDAQPETPRMDVLSARMDARINRKWDIVDEIVETRAETPGDLVAQVELWLAHSTDINLDGTISGINVDAQAEAFALRLPSEIRRLAGAS